MTSLSPLALASTVLVGFAIGLTAVFALLGVWLGRADLVVSRLALIVVFAPIGTGLGLVAVGQSLLQNARSNANAAWAHRR